VVIFNRENHAGLRFWDPLIDLLSDMCVPGDFLVARSMDDLLPAIKPGMEKLQDKKSRSGAEVKSLRGTQFAA
jgi:hypothetical protein